MSKKQFVILACPRTGTNHFISMLNSVPGMDCHSEVFHKHSVFLRNASRPEQMAERDRDPIGFLQQFYANSTGAAVGFKIFIDHNDAVVRHCIEADDIACIVLYRPNFLAAHSSNLIAAQSNQYVVMDNREIKTSQVEFVPKAFHFHYKRYQKFYRDAIEALNARNKPFLFVQYGETQSLPLVQRTFSFLGLPMPEKLQGRAKKLNSTHILSRFTNPELVEETLAQMNCQEWAYESFVSLDSPT